MPYDIESQSRNANFISIARRAIHNPQRRRRCCPLSEAMHSEHDLKERQRRTNHSESFPPWGATLLHNPRRQPRPFSFNLRRSRHHNPRPEGPSNLRTLRPSGRSILRTLSLNPFPQPFYTTRRRQAATTLGAQPRQPIKKRAALRPFFRYNREKRREGMNHDI